MHWHPQALPHYVLPTPYHRQLPPTPHVATVPPCHAGSPGPPEHPAYGLHMDWREVQGSCPTIHFSEEEKPKAMILSQGATETLGFGDGLSGVLWHGTASAAAATVAKR